jgi:hypothetical protein
MTTTFPSATEVTSLSEPTILRFGTLKKKSTNPMKNIGMTASGYEMNAHGMKRRIRKAKISEIDHTRSMVP